MHFFSHGRTMPTLVLLSAITFPAFAAEFYVSPTGSGAGTGSSTNPWNLTTAFAHPASVRPGDTIWLRGGTYEGSFVSRLRGAAGAPIIVRAKQGERPILESPGANNASYVLEVQGSYTWFWGLELRATRQERGGTRAGGLNVFGPNMKFINNIIHDTAGVGVWNGSDNTEMYGNLIFDNGYEGGDRGHGHAIYSQNKNGTKRLVDNIYFNSFGHGIHIYGSETTWFDNYHIEGNFGFNNGIVSRDGVTTNMLVGGGQIANNYVVKDNVTFQNAGAPGNGRSAYFGYNGAGCNNFAITGNTFVGSPTALILGCTNTTMTGNTILGATSGFSQGTYPSNSYLTSRSNGGTKIYVRPNQFESGRAHVAVLNWAGLGSVGINLSGVLNVGDPFEVVDAQDYFGAPVYAGTYAGAMVYVPTLNQSVYRSFGNIPVPPQHTPSEFNAFLVRRTNGTQATPIRPPVLSAGPDQTIALPSTTMLNGAVTDAGFPVGTMTTLWTLANGPGWVAFGNAASTQTSVTFSTAGVYVLNLAANNGTLSASSTVTVIVKADPAGAGAAAPTPAGGVLNQPLRINAGGPAYRDTTGANWVPDIYFTGGSAFSSPGPIVFTPEANLYNTQRLGDFTYSIPVQNGLWALTLRFSELEYQAPNKRVFDVYVNGVLMAAAYDVYARANSGRSMLNQGFSVNVADGVMQIRFVSKVGLAAVSALELIPAALNSLPNTTPPPPPPVVVPPPPPPVVVPPPPPPPVVVPPPPPPPVVVPPPPPPVVVPPPPPPPVVVLPPPPTPAIIGAVAGPLRINAGGAEYRDPAGIVWLADQYFTGGDAFSSPGPIIFTNQTGLYSTQRYGDFTYKIPVKNGLWTLQLKFAELVFPGAGKRIFDVYVNGVLVSKNYDVYARTGAARVALNQGITLETKTGFVEIRFVSVTDKAALSGIELTPIRLVN